MAGGKFNFGNVGKGVSALPAVEVVKPTQDTAPASNPSKPTSKKKPESHGSASDEARTKALKFYVTPTEYQQFIKVRGMVSDSKFLYEKFKELLV